MHCKVLLFKSAHGQRPDLFAIPPSAPGGFRRNFARVAVPHSEFSIAVTLDAMPGALIRKSK